MKTCFLFLSHKEEFREKFNRLTKDVTGVDCVYYNPDWDNVFRIYNDYIFRKNLMFYEGNCIFPILYFCSQHPEYDQFIIMEYDVNIKGYSLQEIIDYSLEQLKEHDVILQHPSWTPDNDWHWINKKSKYIYPSRKLKRNYFHLYALKRNIINIIEGAYKSGIIYGHYELLIPTLLYDNNISIGYYSNQFYMYMQYKKEDLPKFLPEPCIYHPEKDPNL